jgi:hypothetical protein
MRGGKYGLRALVDCLGLLFMFVTLIPLLWGLAVVLASIVFMGVLLLSVGMALVAIPVGLGAGVAFRLGLWADKDRFGRGDIPAVGMSDDSPTAETTHNSRGVPFP